MDDERQKRRDRNVKTIEAMEEYKQDKNWYLGKESDRTDIQLSNEVNRHERIEGIKHGHQYGNLIIKYTITATVIFWLIFTHIIAKGF